MIDLSERSLITSAFPQTVIEKIGYYVYRLVDPRDGQTFYVGKGTGNRIFQHVAEALTLRDQSSLKLERIRDIELSGNRVRYVIHRHRLSEAEAFLVEGALIDAYEELTNLQLGHDAHVCGATTVDDLIALYDEDEALIDVPAVLLNLNRQYDRNLTSEEIYERTRGYWVMNPTRHSAVRFAMAVSDGIIREVYEIDGWVSQRASEIVESELRRSDTSQTTSAIRWSFQGKVARDIRERFIGKTVQAGSQNPVRWMNC